MATCVTKRECVKSGRRQIFSVKYCDITDSGNRRELGYVGCFTQGGYALGLVKKRVLDFRIVMKVSDRYVYYFNAENTPPTAY